MDATDLLARLGPWEHGPGPRSARLGRAIADAVADGRLAPGTKLPAERQLATHLGISRGSVARTYAALRAEGTVVTRHGSGTHVGVAGDRSTAAGAGLRADSIIAAVGQRDERTIDLRVAAWDGDDADLVGLHVPDASLRAAVVGHDGYWPAGLPMLREAVAARLTATGLPTSPHQLVLTNGAQQATDVALTTLCRPGGAVAVERTSWPGIFELLAVRHLRPVAVPELAADHLPTLRVLRERRADVAYLVPSFHNPTGAVVPAPVRRLLVEAAVEGGTVVLDDVTLHELWIDGPPPPPLAATVPGCGDHVVTIGSLSKIAWGGLRVGWLRAEGPLLRDLARVKAAFDLGNPVPSQLAALAALEHVDRLLPGRRAELGRRRDAFVAALRAQRPEWRVVPPAGGLSVWVDVGADADRLAVAARDLGVRVPPARACSVDGADLGHLRLSLARPVDELVTAAQRLGAAAERLATSVNGAIGPGRAAGR